MRLGVFACGGGRGEPGDVYGATAPLSRLGFESVLAEAKVQQNTVEVNSWIARWFGFVGLKLDV
mgnify:CR=1 FL=1